MIYALVIILIITVITLSIELYRAKKRHKEHVEGLLEIIEEFAADNQRLLAEQSIKSNWTIGVVQKSKEPGQNKKE